jgi:hypothetical protein
MPTRRTLELIIIGSILTVSAAGTVKLWARKTLASQQPGSIMHGIAEIIVVTL